MICPIGPTGNDGAVGPTGLTGETVHFEHVMYEGFAPHRVAVMVECLTDNVNRTAPEMRVLFRKGQLGTSGSVSWDFNHVGLIEAEPAAAGADAELAAIEAGAQDFEPGDTEAVLYAVIGKGRAVSITYVDTGGVLQAEFNVPLHTHISETLLEVENSRKERGMPVVPWVKKQGLLEAKVLAAMQAVNQSTGEATFLSTPNDVHMQVTHMLAGREPIGPPVVPGMRVSMTDSAVGIAFLAMFLVAALRNVFKLDDNAKQFKWLQLVSAGAVSFGHGANDAQKTMGVIAALLVGTGHLAVGSDGNIGVPTWVEFSAYGAIALGTVWGGWKIIETMGLKITTLHASSGVAANIGAVTSIFGATGLGVPISTTHAAASSVAGAGVASGMGINLKVVGEMVLAWVVTLPTTIVLAFGIFKVTQLPGAAGWIGVGILIAIAGGLIIYAMTHSIGADDVEAEIPDENVLKLPVPAQPHLEGHGPAA